MFIVINSLSCDKYSMYCPIWECFLYNVTSFDDKWLIEDVFDPFQCMMIMSLIGMLFLFSKTNVFKSHQ